MAEKKKGMVQQEIFPAGGDFSSKAIMDMRLKERELRLSSHDYCKNPYRDLDYSAFIYFQILEALNKKISPKRTPVKITEKTLTESSEFVSYNPCVIFPIFIKNEMFLFLETNDENKATYGFHIKRILMSQIIKALADYFSSDKLNKRSGFPSFVKSIDGIIEFKRFAHTSAKIWEQRIMKFIKL